MSAVSTTDWMVETQLFISRRPLLVISTVLVNNEVFLNWRSLPNFRYVLARTSFTHEKRRRTLRYNLTPTLKHVVLFSGRKGNKFLSADALFPTVRRVHHVQRERGWRRLLSSWSIWFQSAKTLISVSINSISSQKKMKTDLLISLGTAPPTRCP